jgi:hypothetical protein
MTANNPHAKTDQSTPVTVNFSHRLTYNAEIGNTNDLVDTVDSMTARATSVLDVMAAHINDSRNHCSTINTDILYWALQSAINEIKDINAVVNAYADSQA